MYVFYNQDDAWNDSLRIFKKYNLTFFLFNSFQFAIIICNFQNKIHCSINCFFNGRQEFSLSGTGKFHCKRCDASNGDQCYANESHFMVSRGSSAPLNSSTLETHHPRAVAPFRQQNNCAFISVHTSIRKKNRNVFFNQGDA